MTFLFSINSLSARVKLLNSIFPQVPKFLFFRLGLIMCRKSKAGQTFPVTPIMDYKLWNVQWAALTPWKQLVNFQQIFIWKVLNPFSSLMTSSFLSLCPAQRDGIMSCCTDLRVQVNLLGVLFVTVDVEPDGCSRAARAAETENNSGAVREDDP